MIFEKNSIRINIATYLLLIVVSFIFGFINAGLSNILMALGWVFIIFSTGLFFFGGKNFVYQGAFCSNWWKLFFVLLLPCIFYLDHLIDLQLDWYNGYRSAAYYSLFTVRFLFTKIPNIKSDDYIMYVMKEIEPGYLEWDDKEIKKQIKAIKSCGYKWHNTKNQIEWKHSKTKLNLRIEGLNAYSPGEIKETYKNVWSKQSNKDVKILDKFNMETQEAMLNGATDEELISIAKKYDKKYNLFTEK